MGVAQERSKRGGAGRSKISCDLLSKLLVSRLIALIMLPYIIPFEEFRLQLILRLYLKDLG